MKSEFIKKQNLQFKFDKFKKIKKSYIRKIKKLTRQEQRLKKLQIMINTKKIKNKTQSDSDSRHNVIRRTKKKRHPKKKIIIKSNKIPTYISLSKRISVFKQISLVLNKIKNKRLYKKLKKPISVLVKKKQKKFKFPLLKRTYIPNQTMNLVFLKLFYLSYILPNSLKDLEYLRFMRRYWNFFILYLHYVKVRKMPHAIFFFNKYNIPNVLLETNKLKLPVISLADSNSLVQKITYPIISNDDSFILTSFYSLLVIKLILITEVSKLKKFTANINHKQLFFNNLFIN